MSIYEHKLIPKGEKVHSHWDYRYFYQKLKLNIKHKYHGEIWNRNLDISLLELEQFSHYYVLLHGNVELKNSFFWEIVEGFNWNIEVISLKQLKHLMKKQLKNGNYRER